MPDLEDLGLDFCLVGPNTQRWSPFRKVNNEVESAAAQWPYSQIKVLSLIHPEERIDYSSISLFCPNLEELHLNLSRAVSLTRFALEWSCGLMTGVPIVAPP